MYSITDKQRETIGNKLFSCSFDMIFIQSPSAEQGKASLYYKPDTSHRLDGVVLLGKGPASSVDRVGNVLERLLGLGRQLADDVGARVVLGVGPLDVEGVQLESRVQAVDVLGGVAGQAAEVVGQAHQFLDVVAGEQSVR